MGINNSHERWEYDEDDDESSYTASSIDDEDWEVGDISTDEESEWEIDVARKGQLLISYTSKDKDKVNTIKQILADQGCKDWKHLDKTGKFTKSRFTKNEPGEPDDKATWSACEDSDTDEGDETSEIDLDLRCANLIEEEVENAQAFLMCYSSKYKNSSTCRFQAESAYKSEKYIIPLRMQKNYNQSGWLGFICFTLLEYDLSGQYPFEKENFITEIKQFIGEKNFEGGQIKFEGHSNTAQYIIVDIDTEMPTVMELLMDWRLETPNLMISVKSGTKPFQITKTLSHTIRSGLTTLALHKRIWIVTEGADLGVTKEVGGAVKNVKILSSSEMPMTVIGIARLDCVVDKESLERNAGQNSDSPILYQRERYAENDDFFLEPNHTHFILVRTSDQSRYNKFRAKLEGHMAELKKKPVPVVQLVVEGGVDTLETVSYSIKNQMPTVIVKNSGGAADILAYAYENSEKPGKIAINEKKYGQLDFSTEENVKMMIKSMCKPDDDGQCTKNIKKIIEQFKLISVFEFESDSRIQDIEEAILHAFLKAHKLTPRDEMALNSSCNTESDEQDVDKQARKQRNETFLFLSTIKDNRVEILEQLLDTGVSIEKIFDVEDLMFLCEEIPIVNLQWLEGEAEHKTRKSQQRTLVERLMQTITKKTFGLPLETTGKGKEGKTRSKVQPRTFLFIWSVLMIRQQMAKIFWTEGEDPIATALVGYSMLKLLKDNTPNTELIIRIENSMREWSALAMGVLSECFSNNTHKSQDLLLRKLPNWGNTNCVSIAKKAHNKDFISHPACQMLLDSRWKGNLNRDLSMFKIMVCVVCPILIGPMINQSHMIQIETAATSSSEGNGKKERTSSRRSLTRSLKSSLDDRQSHMSKKQTSTTSVRSGESEKNSTSYRGSRSSDDSQSNGNGAITAMPDLERDADKTKLSVQGQESNTDETGMALQDRNHYAASEQKQERTKQVIEQQIPIWQKMKYFFTAPVTIFCYNFVSYAIFLGLYTYVILFTFGPKVSNEEIVLIIWVFNLFTEEIRQVSESRSLLNYPDETWNIVDIASLLFFTIGILLRFLPYYGTLEAARVVLSLNIVLYFLRVLHIFSIHKSLGPKLVMIRKMVKDLVLFLVIMSLFLVSYAIASHAILYPNSPVTWKTLQEVVRKPYWNMFGELFLDEIEGEELCSNDQTLWSNDTYPRCPSKVGKVVVPILMGLYVLLTNILLINLLIAMFSYTFIKVQSNTDKHWCFQRYSLIREYRTRSVIPPPFIAFVHLLKLVKRGYSHISCNFRGIKVSPSKITSNKKESHDAKIVQKENINEETQENTELQNNTESQESMGSQVNIESNATIESQEHIKSDGIQNARKSQSFKNGDEVNLNALAEWEKIMADRYVQKQKQQELGNMHLNTMKTLIYRTDQLHETLRYLSRDTASRLEKLEVTAKNSKLIQNRYQKMQVR